MSRGRSVPARGQGGQNEPQIQSLSCLLSLSSRLSSSGITQVAEFSRNHPFFRKLLARDQLVPIVHGTTYEALRDVSPMLASRTGLDTGENTMAEVAAKLAELVALP